MHASCCLAGVSLCRSVAEGDGTRQISVLSIMVQDENESMAMTQNQKAD